MFLSHCLPVHLDAVDGLLAAVTDLLTHVLTIGKAILSFGLQPQTRSLLIHILNGFTHDDLLDNEHSDSTLPSRFHELLNMFPDNKVRKILIDRTREGKNKRTCLDVLTQSSKSYIIVIQQEERGERKKHECTIEWRRMMETIMSMSIISDGCVCPVGRRQFE